VSCWVALALAGGVAAPPAVASGASTTRATTTPSLTGSFPLGSRRLHRSSTAHPASTPVRHGSQATPGTGKARPAAAAAVSSLVWILIVLGAIGLTAVLTVAVQRRRMNRAKRRGDQAGETPIAEAGPEAPTDLGPVKFILYQDNGGGYYWTIVDAGGEVIARSVGFLSYAEANFAADIVHRAAPTATFEDRSGASPPPRPLARSDASAEGGRSQPPPNPGGSVSREEVTRRAKAARAWPAGSSSTPGGRRR